MWRFVFALSFFNHLTFNLSLFLNQDTFKSQITEDYSIYELFSVIIHSGSAYGGHYHTYIKDFDNLGEWDKIEQPKTNEITSKPNSAEDKKHDEFNPAKEICLVCCDDDEFKANSNNSKVNNELVNLDYLKYDNPLELVKAFVYNKHKYEFVKIDSLCGDLSKTTGMSWNKTFKPKYGAIEKFLRKYDDTFELDTTKMNFKLKPHDRINIVSSRDYKNENRNDLIKSCLNEVPEENKPSESVESLAKEEYEAEIKLKHHWFDFDDSRITPIYPSTISKQFKGKESAYMLFYRRKVVDSKDKNRNEHVSKIPEWLRNEISKENLALNEKRVEFENRINKIRVECYLENDFYCEQNVLNLKQQYEHKSFQIDIDKRSTNLEALKEALVKICTEQETNQTNLDDHSKDMQKRKEAVLNNLFDESPTYWLLAKKVKQTFFFIFFVVQQRTKNYIYLKFYLKVKWG